MRCPSDAYFVDAASTRQIQTCRAPATRQIRQSFVWHHAAVFSQRPFVMAGPETQTFPVSPPPPIFHAPKQAPAAWATKALAFLPAPDSRELDSEEDYASHWRDQSDQPGEVGGHGQRAHAGKGVVERRDSHGDRNSDDHGEKAERQHPQAHFIDVGHETPLGKPPGHPGPRHERWTRPSEGS